MLLAEMRQERWLGAVLALGIAAMALRDVGTLSFLVPVAAAVGVASVEPRSITHRDAATWIVVTAVGASAFAIVRIATTGAPARATSFALLASVIAAVAEEAVFRRGMYGWLVRLFPSWGASYAIVVAAVAFGLVHAPMYGWNVVPVDVAAGLVLGWQRWACGTWTSAAATHALANILGSI